MATIKNTTNALGNLINQINGAAPPVGAGASPFSATYSNPSATFGSAPSIGIDDESIPTNMLNTEPVFTINYKSTQKQCIKKASNLLKIIVNEIVPSLMQKSAVIVDKVDQDAEQLGNLYYEWAKTEKTIQALIDILARGETQARLFEVYIKMSESLLKLCCKITEVQNQMRKYYIDTYLDIQQKDSVDDTLSLPATPRQEEIHALELAGPALNVMVGTDQTIKLIQERKKQAMMAKFEEVK